MKLEIYRDVYMPDYDSEKGKSLQKFKKVLKLYFSVKCKDFLQ